MGNLAFIIITLSLAMVFFFSSFLLFFLFFFFPFFPLLFFCFKSSAQGPPEDAGRHFQFIMPELDINELLILFKSVGFEHRQQQRMPHIKDSVQGLGKRSQHSHNKIP